MQPDVVCLLYTRQYFSVDKKEMQSRKISWEAKNLDTERDILGMK